MSSGASCSSSSPLGSLYSALMASTALRRTNECRCSRHACRDTIGFHRLLTCCQILRITLASCIWRHLGNCIGRQFQVLACACLFYNCEDKHVPTYGRSCRTPWRICSHKLTRMEGVSGSRISSSLMRHRKRSVEPRRNSLGCCRLLRRFWQMRICGAQASVSRRHGASAVPHHADAMCQGAHHHAACRRNSTCDQLQRTLLTISGRIFPFASVFSIVSCTRDTCLLEYQIAMAPRTVCSNTCTGSVQKPMTSRRRASQHVFSGNRTGICASSHQVQEQELLHSVVL